MKGIGWLLGGLALGGGVALVVARRPHWVGLAPAPSSPPQKPTAAPAPPATPPHAAPAPPSAPRATRPAPHAAPAPRSSDKTVARPTTAKPATPAEPSPTLPPGFNPPPGADATHGLEDVPATRTSQTGPRGPLDPDELASAFPDDTPAS